MRKQYHILNGDSLKDQFPEIISGEIIIARECLVDGNVKGNNLIEFFKTRAKFISNNYNGYNEKAISKRQFLNLRKCKKSQH